MTNFKALKEDIPIEQALDLFGYSYKTRGHFKCVSKEHNDNKPSMSINKKNNTCHCFSCNATFNPVSLAMQELDTNARKASIYLIERLGLNKSDYIVDDHDSLDYIDFPFTSEEIQKIGLKMSYHYTINSDYDKYFKIEEEVREDADLFNSKEDMKQEIIDKERMAEKTMHKDSGTSLIRIYREDEEAFYYIIKSAIENRIAELDNGKGELEKLFNEAKKDFYDSGNKSDRDRVVKIYLKMLADPYSVSLKESEYLVSDSSKKILEAYIPLRNLHNRIDEFNEMIEDVKNLESRIPDKYKAGLDELIESSFSKEQQEEEINR